MSQSNEEGPMEIQLEPNILQARGCQSPLDHDTVYCRFPPVSAIAWTVIIAMLAEGYHGDKDHGPMLYSASCINTLTLTPCNCLGVTK